MADTTCIRWLENLGNDDVPVVGGKNASLGENVVQGAVTPDEYVVFKPLLAQEQYQLFIVQARPETVQSRKEAGILKSYRLKERGERLLQGLAIGQSVSSGTVQVIKDTDEYANLIGGSSYEPEEPNPMLGFRGASRYYSDRYREGFALECRAIRRVRDRIGLGNVIVMIPFCRTPEEGDRVIEVVERVAQVESQQAGSPEDEAGSGGRGKKSSHAAS